MRDCIAAARPLPGPARLGHEPDERMPPSVRRQGRYRAVMLPCMDHSRLPALTLARANQYGWLTKRHFHSDIRTFMRMSREVAQILQIEDRGLHRHGKIFDRKARAATAAASGRTGG